MTGNGLQAGAETAENRVSEVPETENSEVSETETSEVPKKVLFVCLGNICRSPAAEGIMRKLVEKEGLGERIEIDSAGTYGGHAGELPDPRMRRAGAARGYDFCSPARQIRTDDFDRFDMIVTMDDSNYERVHRLAPSTEAAQKIFRMTEFCRHHPDANHIPDPYYEGAEGFEKVLDLLEDACSGLLSEIKAAAFSRK